MALALIGQSLLSAVIQVLADRLASPEVLGFFKTQKLNDGLLEKLKETLNTVNGLLDDAEEKQITKPAVKNWLNDVKHAVYEAEDLLEEIDYEVRRFKEEAAAQTVTTQVRNFLPFLNPANKRMKEMEAELEKFFERLERLVKHKGDLRHIEGTTGGRPSPEKTTPLVNESHVYGREADKEAIMELLTKNEENGPNVVAVPIVGMGGIGKTTLAQLIYKYKKVEECFQLKAWVWASERFDVTIVVDDILKKINANTSATKEPDESLKDALKEKTFLLVLDDVWNIEYNEWDKLLLPLQYAKQVKIIVTTRDEGVVKVMRTVVPSYLLKGISDNDCWRLFARHAFSGMNSDAPSHLQEFGREIVRKCKGLPLAVKTLGGLLRSEGDAKEWEKISKSSMWGLSNENIPPALRLSYYYLPSYLKRCFAYCAIFPKGYEFRKEELIPFWMAEGFLIPSRGDEMEERGERYFNELVSRSFFQQSSKYDSSLFSMHDLIIDLAEYASGEFCFKFVVHGEWSYGTEGENSCMLLGRTRYLSFTSRHNHVSKVFERIHEVQHLRTFLSLSNWLKHPSINMVLHDIFTTLKRLRMLSLSVRNIDLLPNSICNLKHLRHLDLSFTSIERLPENVSTLYNLQTLILEGCPNLIELPTNMSKLVNLQHLHVQKTQLKAMPPEMGELKKLRKLTDFFLGKQNGSSIKELGKLFHLRSSLSIWNLQNVTDVQDALDTNLKGKEQLEQLMLKWGGETDDTQHERNVLEKLEPSINLKRLYIIGFGGTKFPNWVGNSSFSNMASLTLIGCKNCTSLPPLGQLPSLERLCIEGFIEVVTVGLEFYGSEPWIEKPFKSLKKLSFLKMPQWKEWNTDVAGAFPVLEDLQMYACPKLVGSFPAAPKLTQFNLNNSLYTQELYPSGEWCLVVSEGSLLKGIKRASGVFSSITKVEFRGCGSLKSCQLDFLPHFSKFIIRDCLELESLRIREGPLLSLHQLVVIGCPNLKSLPENMHSLLPSLEKLVLGLLPQVDSFPEETLLLPSTITSLEFNCLRNLKSLDYKELQQLTSLRNLKICQCPKLEFIPEKSLPSSIEHLEIMDLKDLDYKGLQHLTSLRQLKIWSCSKLENIPEESLPSSLEHLEIWNMKDLNYKGLQHLTSLRRLKICGCPKLVSLPEEGLPSSLRYLEIRNLENLESLNYKGLQHLNSLRRLHIWMCPKLKSMPEEGLPSSLEYLKIIRCPSLAKSCERKTGKDWPKISHIPGVTIKMLSKA